MLIIDSHAHIFPFLGGKSEYESKEIQLMYAQKLISDHFEPARKLEDFSVIDQNTLWDRNKLGPEGMYDVDFRAGKFGRYEWTKDGIDYCKQYMPVGLQEMVAPPEFLIAQMNHIGVDKAVLQRAHIYGKLENYYHDAIGRFPQRLIGLVQIDESKAYTDEQIAELHRAIGELGFSGLYFEPGALFVNGFRHNFDEAIFGPFWAEVDSLSTPIFVQTDRSKFLDQMKSWRNILEKYPNMVFVISLGLPEQLALRDGEVHIPELVHDLVSGYKVFLELAYPVSMGKKSDYPYPDAQRLIKHLYDAFGPEKLVWGTDIPNVERYCTYAQSLTYITHYCNFLSEHDKELILGKNVLRIFGLES